MARDAPRPRLCHLRKWPDFSGYGFNLHAEKGKAGHLIGKVDDDSPSKAGGLQEGDRIVEVNGTNIGNENHQQVVARIKTVPHETKILVVDAETDEHYRQKKVVVKGSMTEVLIIETPLVNPFVKTSISSPSADTLHKAKLCDLKIWSNFIGYGFNLHAEKGNPSHIIGKVDPRSPAEVTGLKAGDRISEVNGVCVLNEPHHEVVRRIKTDLKKVTLLLVDAEAETFLLEKGGNAILNETISVVHFACPETNPFLADATTTENNSLKESSTMNNDSNLLPSDTNQSSAASTESQESSIRPPQPSASRTPSHHHLCHMKIPEEGPKCFGFTMHAKKGTPGHFITEVETGSIAELSGLRRGDRVIEVNGANVENATHRQVVEKIKAVADETMLLVIHDSSDHNCSLEAHQRSNNQIAVENGNQKMNQSKEENAKNHEIQSPQEDFDDDISVDYRKITDEMIEVAEREGNAELNANGMSKSEQSTAGNVVESPKLQPNRDAVERGTIKTQETVVVSGLEFAPSAEEARKRMTKKSRVKDENMSIRDKFRLFERL